MSRLITLFFLFLGTLFSVVSVQAQRVYKPASVLASGTWYKIATTAPGIYKLDMGFLNSLGITASFSTGSLQVFGRSGGMLPEANKGIYIDGLQEVALQMVDGGDGVMNGSDYALFYAPGPDKWRTDTAARSFSHVKNLYSNETYYYITMGSNGRRVASQNATPISGPAVRSFNSRTFHHLDSVNFLNSGKEWFGEEFSGAPGRLLTRALPLPAADFEPATPIYIITNVVSRSIGAGSRFSVLLNGQVHQQIEVPPVSGAQYDAFARQVQSTATINGVQRINNYTLSYVPGSFNAQGWLNWIEVHGRQPLNIGPGQLLFRDWNSVGNPSVTFALTNAGITTQVWDVSQPLQPVKMDGSLVGSDYLFSANASNLREYIGFSTTFLNPHAIGGVANQNLHAGTDADYFIITHASLLVPAQRLASFHQQRNGLRVKVVTTEQVFNEFSAGQPDPTAIRDFLKMHYDLFKNTWTASPKYLLLFGKASFDYKDRIRNNTSLVPAYQSNSSLDPLGTYTSDDFFGFLEDAEDINSSAVVNTLDIGIGRVPAQNKEEATNFADKVEAYFSATSMGPWRNSVTFIADDEDNNLHLQDAETITATVTTTAPRFDVTKIYLDAFKQEGGLAGGRYPTANTFINNTIEQGTLIWNYNGHGGPVRLAEEVVLDQHIVNNWKNANKLPLFITATCDFAPFDNPLTQSLGENLLVRKSSGAIALMTTTRIVFAFSNRVLNDNYLRLAMERLPDGSYRSLGRAVQDAKNYTYQTSGDIVNNRKFALLGDPALTLAFPALSVVPTSINGISVAQRTDTLRATDQVIVTGEVRDNAGALQNSFNGTVYLTLFDKQQPVTTLGNDAGSFPVTFQQQATPLFRGKASVKDGLFQLEFKLPKDINYSYGRGKISLYAQNGLIDGNGFTDSLIVGGIGNATSFDTEGPVIKAYLNDEQFVNGSITNKAPILLIKLTDSSGINTSGTGIGHDLVATLDGDEKTYYVLNAFYESELDNYQKGTIRFQLPELPSGPHQLKIKAWDALNNSSEYLLDFVVVNEEALTISHVLNYPNPFTTQTTFWFEHNQPLTDLQTKVDIYTVSGRLIKTLSQTINTSGNRSSEIAWDGRDAYGNRVGKGIYIYCLQVSANEKKQVKWEKLAILQ